MSYPILILTKTKKHDIDILIDEIFITEFANDKNSALERLSEAVELALEESDGLLKLPSCPPFLVVKSKLAPSYNRSRRSLVIKISYRLAYDAP